ncbi:NAD-dependent epimerase/dehydratase family protein, partial [Candidatus Pelagibacter sp.]|nr:NAD-dependent epimerase/dehydratase family protein [Candidatus Pelagibacter sp.]
IDRIGSNIKNSNYKFIKKDLYNLNRKNLPNIKFDYIIHLAGIPSPVYYKQFPLRTIYLNSELTRELLEISKKNKSKFIFFSSSEIYGNPFPQFIPTKETYLGNVSSISDRSCYDESKRMGETFTYIYKNNYNIDAKIIRPFNFYGNGMRFNDERIIPRFFNQSYKNKDLTVFSNGKQTRSYCHILDAIVMMVKIIFKGNKFVYNVGNPSEEINAEMLANKILKITQNKNVKINKIPYPENYPSDEPKRRCPSINNFKNEFKFSPKINLNEGLKYFNEYARYNFKKT